MQTVKIKTISSLEKVLPNKEPVLTESHGGIFYEETLNFQIAYSTDEFTRERIDVVAKGELSPFVKIRTEGLVPSLYLPNNMDDYYLSDKAELIPDPLFPLDEMKLMFSRGVWKALWVTVRVPASVRPADYPLNFEFINEKGEKVAETTYSVTVLGVTLPETDLILTNWVHYDCIAEKHGVSLFGEDFYKIFDKYLGAYVSAGFNMLFTPLFTPPLDTAIGNERETAQLVKVFLSEGKYSFDFSDLKKFIDFALKRKIKYFEFSHLFTQWGGGFCPKIIADTEEGQKRIFGWDKDALGEEYAGFLAAFLPELVKFIEENHLKDKVFFHLTDEPNDMQVGQYEKCRDLVKKHIGDMPVMDALSHYEFRRLVDIPAVCISAYANFASRGAHDVLVYN
ncbi:MAG: hypothetical protein IJS67_01060, partial [Clostridia bacterium]|nr:hypothetical protein [Clostridia bacterium]